MEKAINNQRGAAAIISIIVISAVSLAFVVSAARKSIDESTIVYQMSRGNETFATAEACVEETLLRIKRDTSYGLGSGQVNLTVGTGECIIEVTGSGDSRAIVVIGMKDPYYKKVQVDLTLDNNYITIENWQELSD